MMQEISVGMAPRPRGIHPDDISQIEKRLQEHTSRQNSVWITFDWEDSYKFINDYRKNLQNMMRSKKREDLVKGRKVKTTVVYKERKICIWFEGEPSAEWLKSKGLNSKTNKK